MVLCNIARRENADFQQDFFLLEMACKSCWTEVTQGCSHVFLQIQFLVMRLAQKTCSGCPTDCPLTLTGIECMRCPGCLFLNDWISPLNRRGIIMSFQSVFLWITTPTIVNHRLGNFLCCSFKITHPPTVTWRFLWVKRCHSKRMQWTRHSLSHSHKGNSLVPTGHCINPGSWRKMTEHNLAFANRNYVVVPSSSNMKFCAIT